jgi:hypothetical protein
MKPFDQSNRDLQKPNVANDVILIGQSKVSAGTGLFGSFITRTM